MISIYYPHLGGLKVSSATAALQEKVKGNFFHVVIGAILLGWGTEVEVESGTKQAWTFAPALHGYMKHSSAFGTVSYQQDNGHS